MEKQTGALVDLNAASKRKSEGECAPKFIRPLSSYEGELEDYKAPVVPCETKVESFREWFGESKVVDEHGLPIKVYHGTNQQFREFDTTPIHELDRRRMGAYFTANPKFASFYGSHQIDAYLSINNPLDIRGLSAEQAIALLPVTAFEKAAMRSAFRGQDYSQYGLLESANQIALRKTLEQAGYDGVAYIEGYEAAFIVFWPEQIHRVIGHDNDYQPPTTQKMAKAKLVSCDREIGIDLVADNHELNEHIVAERLRLRLEQISDTPAPTRQRPAI